MKHNSVLRALKRLVKTGVIEQTRVECDPRTGLVDPDDIRKALRSNTRLLAVVHGSNVTGTLQPVAELVRMAPWARTLLAARRVSASDRS